MSELRGQQAATDVPSDETLESSIRRGTRSVIAAQVASQVVSFGLLAALYRLVAPAEFGLLGMVVPLLLLAKIFASFGLNVAVVQQRRLTDGQLSNVFWANLLVGLLATVVVALSGPLAAWAYQTPELKPLVAALAGTLLLAALGAQHQALLERKLQIGRLVTVRLIAQATGGAAAIVAAFAQWGVWALVVQQYVELATLALLVWQLEKWRPQRWDRKQWVSELLKFGGFYSLSSLMFYFAQNADKILIALVLGGSREGQVALGHYTQAFNLMMKPVYLVTTPVTGIMLPALSRVAHRPQEFETLIARFYRMVAIALFPCGFGLVIVGWDVMILLGGSDWARAGSLLMALAPTILAQGLINISGSVYAAVGHARTLFVAALATAAIMCTAVIIGLALGRQTNSSPDELTLNVACAYAIATVLLIAVPYLIFCFRTVGVSVKSVLAPLTRPAAYSLVMGLVAWGIVSLCVSLGVVLPLRLALVVTGGVVTYGLLARRELRWLVEQLRDG